jgi:hypothetical protein
MAKFRIRELNKNEWRRSHEGDSRDTCSTQLRTPSPVCSAEFFLKLIFPKALAKQPVDSFTSTVD